MLVSTSPNISEIEFNIVFELSPIKLYVALS